MRVSRRDFLLLMSAMAFANVGLKSGKVRTSVSIEGDRFLINGRPTYEGRNFNGMKIEGLLMNARMVQGIFDDLNFETRPRWQYPDTGEWEPWRNTREFIANSNVVTVSDFLLLHGNGIKDPERIKTMVEQTRQVPGYRTMPILFNEDDHFDFDKPINNMIKAVSAYASWGYFDPGKNDYSNGYQCPPINWSINTERKKAFFRLLKEVTG